MPHGIPLSVFDWFRSVAITQVESWFQEEDFESDQLRRESLAEQQALQHPDSLDPEHPSTEREA